MRIFNNALYKIVALFLAVLLWMGAQGFRSIEQSLDIPIAHENTPADVVVIAQSAREVNLRLNGSRAALRRAAKQLVRYPIDLSGVRPGEARFAIEVERLQIPRGATVSARSPSTVTLTLDSRTSKRVPVRVDWSGEPREGYRVLGVSVEPEAVNLEGARFAMRRIRDVLTDRIDVSGMEENAVIETRLSLESSDIWRVEPLDPIRVEVLIEGPPADAEAEGSQTGGVEDE